MVQERLKEDYLAEMQLKEHEQENLRLKKKIDDLEMSLTDAKMEQERKDATSMKLRQVLTISRQKMSHSSTCSYIKDCKATMVSSSLPVSRFPVNKNCGKGL